MDTDPPKRVSDRIHDLNIDGYLMAVDSVDQPILLGMPGTEDKFVAVFSTKEKLEALHDEYAIGFTRIKQIDDGPDFLDSLKENLLPFRLRVAVDAYKHENGRMRFLEIPL